MRNDGQSAFKQLIASVLSTELSVCIKINDVLAKTTANANDQATQGDLFT